MDLKSGALLGLNPRISFPFPGRITDSRPHSQLAQVSIQPHLGAVLELSPKEISPNPIRAQSQLKAVAATAQDVSARNQPRFGAAPWGRGSGCFVGSMRAGGGSPVPRVLITVLLSFPKPMEGSGGGSDLPPHGVCLILAHKRFSQPWS